MIILWFYFKLLTACSCQSCHLTSERKQSSTFPSGVGSCSVCGMFSGSIIFFHNLRSRVQEFKRWFGWNYFAATFIYWHSLGFQSHHILSHDCRLHIGISRGCVEVQILLFLDFLQHLDSFSVYLLWRVWVREHLKEKTNKNTFSILSFCWDDCCSHGQEITCHGKSKMRCEHLQFHDNCWWRWYNITKIRGLLTVIYTSKMCS